jgi:BirA family biotin operon repressor/biotin-[acetyl-CoA-carboxylase] ligase
LTLPLPVILLFFIFIWFIKMDVRSLVSQLSDGAFHSGSSLGESLGVSRAAIWKALGRLSEFNLDIDSVKGKGYRLRGGIDLLSFDKILEEISPCHQEKINLNLLLSTESTNSWLMSRPLPSRKFEICLSEMQKGGRGRRGKVWVSPFGKNIYLSVAFDLQGGVEALNGLSLVIGLAVIRMLKSLGLAAAVLKWPNDIWIESKKAAGILVELQGEATTGWRVVAGVGLNVSMGEIDGESIDQPWVSIAESIVCRRSELAGQMINILIEVLEEYQERGFECFMSEWDESDFLKGKKVLGSGGIEGVAMGINAQGALLVETSEGLKCINAGEVSVRPVCD